MNTHRLNHKDYISLAGNNLNYFEITGSQKDAVREQFKERRDGRGERFSNWNDCSFQLGDYQVIPFGENNDIPTRIQESVFPNSLAPRLQNRKVELLFEQGPYLYRHANDGTRYFRQPVTDKKITDWLYAMDIENLLLHNGTDYYYQNHVFVKVLRERSGRLGLSNSKPSAVERMEGFDCRLAYRKGDKRKKPTHVIVGDWEDSMYGEWVVYPLYDPKNPGKYRVSVHHAKYSSFGMREYPMPEIFGSLDWIDRSTSIPKIFKALTENSLNIKWHIQSPARYWKDKRDILIKNATAAKREYKEQELENLKKEILDKLSLLLSGVDNVGKFWHNEYVVEMIGANAVEHGWKIFPIEQKIKEYVMAQIEISNKADFATVAGLGLHAALGNVGADGKSNPGGEQLYALKIHQITSVNIPEFYVCKAINDIIRVKFDTDIKIGFYHLNPEREQDITTSKRTVNQNPAITAL